MALMALISHEVMVPEPVMVGESGRSLLAVLLVMVKSFGEYAIVGTSSLTSMVMVVDVHTTAIASP